MKRKLVLIILVVLAISVLAGCTEDLQRQVKDVTSGFTGLERVVTLYSDTGETIQTWRGRFDVKNDGISRKVLFDENGKRTIIHGGIIVIQEL